MGCSESFPPTLQKSLPSPRKSSKSSGPSSSPESASMLVAFTHSRTNPRSASTISAISRAASQRPIWKATAWRSLPRTASLVSAVSRTAVLLVVLLPSRVSLSRIRTSVRLPENRLSRQLIVPRYSSGSFHVCHRLSAHSLTIVVRMPYTTYSRLGGSPLPAFSGQYPCSAKNCSSSLERPSN